MNTQVFTAKEKQLDIRKKQRTIVDALEDMKGRDIVVFNTEHLTPHFERVVIASGDSTRHVKSLADHVAHQIKKSGGKVHRLEGEDTGEWVLVDLGDAILHVMHPTIRAYYHLEEIWGGKTVRIKAQATTPRRSSDPSIADEAPVVAKKKKAKKPAKKKTVVRISTQKKTTARVSAKKPAKKRSVSTAKPAVKKSAKTSVATRKKTSAAKRTR